MQLHTKRKPAALCCAVHDFTDARALSSAEKGLCAKLNKSSTFDRAYEKSNYQGTSRTWGLLGKLIKRTRVQDESQGVYKLRKYVLFWSPTGGPKLCMF